MTSTLTDLANEYREYTDALLACDPPVDEDSLDNFTAIQDMGDHLMFCIGQSSFTLEQVEDAADW